MKLIYEGKFNGDIDTLPHGEHQPNAVKFKEADSPKKLAIIGNSIALVLTAAALIGFCLRSDLKFFGFFGALLSLLTLFPHEILHALCFKGEVHLYINLSKGMLFVVGPEVMSKKRFVFMSMLPNLILGFLPYILFMIFPRLTVLGVMGAFNIGAGAGDYYNVFHALTQMPKGAKTYMYKFNSYWFMPNEH